MPARPIEDLGRGLRCEDGDPGGFGLRKRLRVLDAEGIAAAALVMKGLFCEEWKTAASMRRRATGGWR